MTGVDVDIPYFPKLTNLTFVQERLGLHLDNKSHEIARIEGETKKLKEEVARADQVNNNMRAKTMDLELEKESLQVNKRFTTVCYCNVI